jgi:hypothetical protein
MDTFGPYNGGHTDEHYSVASRQMEMITRVSRRSGSATPRSKFESRSVTDLVRTCAQISADLDGRQVSRRDHQCRARKVVMAPGGPQNRLDGRVLREIICVKCPG